MRVSIFGLQRPCSGTTVQQVCTTEMPSKNYTVLAASKFASRSLTAFGLATGCDLATNKLTFENG